MCFSFTVGNGLDEHLHNIRKHNYYHYPEVAQNRLSSYSQNFQGSLGLNTYNLI